MKVLVTGASGIVGSAIVTELLARGHSIRLALRRPDQASRFGGGVTHAMIGDLAEPVDWAAHLDGVDALVHAAGLAHARTKAAQRQLFAVNVDATDRLMRAAQRAGVSQAIHISSVRAVTGATSEAVVVEDQPPNPTNDYGRSKLLGEKAVAASGVAGAILRPPLVHGAYVRANLALLAKAAASPLPLPFGGLNARRSIVSDRNLASAVAYLLEQPQQGMLTALVADAEALSGTDIVIKLRAAAGRPPRLMTATAWLPPLLAAIGQRQIWDSLAGRLELAPRRLAALGWQPVEPSDAGLARTIATLRAERSADRA
jgi:nucleoside-diphosphate-sugar epimerase